MLKIVDASLNLLDFRQKCLRRTAFIDSSSEGEINMVVQFESCALSFDISLGS
jgi:hypothetical protein